MAVPTIDYHDPSLQSYAELLPPRAPSAALHDNCAGCDHPRDGKCPYLISPRDRLKWPCYFRLHVAVGPEIEIYTGPSRRRIDAGF